MMLKKLALPGFSLLVLAAAVVSGNQVSERTQIDTFQHVEAVGSGFQRLRHFIASALYLQLDDYHHIEMYQGIPWTGVTDYLPQMWLIARLDPHFTEVYNDASYHLAVNLGRVEEGIDFIEEGLRNNPDSLDIRYQYAYLLWETGSGTPLEVMEACAAYRVLVRRAGGDHRQPYSEPASEFIMGSASAAIDSSGCGPRFENRADFLKRAIWRGLYYPGYLADPPGWLMPESARENP